MASAYQKIKLLQGLLTGEYAHTGPFHAVVGLTSRCNLRCVGCRYHSVFAQRQKITDETFTDEYLPYETMETLCLDLRRLRCSALLLMGEGEPLLHPRILDIVSLVKGMGFHATVITNGTLLTEEMLEGFIKRGLDCLQVSLWASSAAEYEKQYSGSHVNNYYRVVDALKHAAALKKQHKKTSPAVVLHHVINRHNFENLDQVVKLAASTNCNALSLSPFLTAGGGLDEYAVPGGEEGGLRFSLLGLKKTLGAHGLHHNIERTLLRYRVRREQGWNVPCYAGWYHTRIRSDGTVQPCGLCNVPCGNLKQKSFIEIWNDQPYRRFRKQALKHSSFPADAEGCYCDYCCYAEDSLRVHRLFRYALPGVRRRVGKNGVVGR